MGEFGIFLLLLVNGGVCFWNAREAGRVWAESQAVGGWIRIVTWCTAIQSGLGFSYIYMYILSMVAWEMNLISYSTMNIIGDLAFLIIVLPIIGTGLIMTIHSWIAAKREASLLNLGIAGWNTFASVYNTYHAIQGFGPALEHVKEYFSDMLSNEDSDDDERFNVIIIVALALLAGIVTTIIVIQRYAGTLEVPESVKQHGRLLTQS